MFLFGRKFILKTDHQVHTTLLAKSDSGHWPLRIYRWSDRLHRCDFDIQYTAGSKNQVADMLSRLVNDETCKSMTDDYVMEFELGNLVTLLDLKAASSTDVTLTQVRQNGWSRHPPAGLETYFRLRDELSVFDDVCASRGIRAVIPTSLQQQVLHMSHEGHPGIVRTKQRCRNTVWWPAIDRHIETVLRDCESYAVCEKSMKPTQPPLHT